MKLILIADDDSQVGQLDPAPCDVLISLGDLWDGTIEKAMLRYSPDRVLAVRGNHDTNAPFAPGVASLHTTVVEHGGLRFGGFGGCWRYKPRGHHLYDQEEVIAALKDFPRVDVFVSHNSPRGIHQRDDEVHQGFDAFLAYIERAKPAYFIHGHQHLNTVTVHGETTVIGIFGEGELLIPR
ncbi:metallophosphoesterase family protein [Haloferula sp. BvORR071]|uniref:metallophosphoesterase family protein n=1 Tax=Haloferula sp. BvORR071 TaxID=1396141 RepID=UPI0006987909|nr:metallophosphoesterase family protein [Haloferula sp. BvORR071]